MLSAFGSTAWNDDLFSGLYHLNDQWEVVFTPKTTSPTGTYEIRVMFDDKEGGQSDYNETTINVMNNQPESKELQLPSATMFRSETITISVRGYVTIKNYIFIF